MIVVTPRGFFLAIDATILLIPSYVTIMNYAQIFMFVWYLFFMFWVTLVWLFVIKYIQRLFKQMSPQNVWILLRSLMPTYVESRLKLLGIYNLMYTDGDFPSTDDLLCFVKPLLKKYHLFGKPLDVSVNHALTIFVFTVKRGKQIKDYEVAVLDLIDTQKLPPQTFCTIMDKTFRLSISSQWICDEFKK